MSQRPGLMHELTFLEWITGPRCPRQCLSGTSPLWKVFHGFFGSGINSAKGTEIILYCSVSPYSLSRAGWTTFESRPSTEVLKAIAGLIKRSANNTKVHCKYAYGICYPTRRELTFS